MGKSKKAIGRGKGRGTNTCPPKSVTKRGRGQPPFEANDEQRRVVKLLAGFGIPHERIRLIVLSPYSKQPISKVTLEKVFAHELAVGAIEMDAICMASLGNKIREGNMTGIIWYTKNRMGWRDSFTGEFSGPGGAPLMPPVPPVLNLLFCDDTGEEPVPEPSGTMAQEGEPKA